jgi:hypothetical protein
MIKVIEILKSLILFKHFFSFFFVKSVELGGLTGGYLEVLELFHEFGKLQN